MFAFAIKPVVAAHSAAGGRGGSAEGNSDLTGELVRWIDFTLLATCSIFVDDLSEHLCKGAQLQEGMAAAQVVLGRLVARMSWRAHRARWQAHAPWSDAVSLLSEHHLGARRATAGRSAAAQEALRLIHGRERPDVRAGRAQCSATLCAQPGRGCKP